MTAVISVTALNREGRPWTILAKRLAPEDAAAALADWTDRHGYTGYYKVVVEGDGLELEHSLPLADAAALIDRIAEADGPAPVPAPCEPLLGCATTEQLIRELIVRFTVPGTNVRHALVLAELVGSLSALDREYRTVSS
jgi:hypothetical protein